MQLELRLKLRSHLSSRSTPNAQDVPDEHGNAPVERTDAATAGACSCSSPP